MIGISNIGISNIGFNKRRSGGLPSYLKDKFLFLWTGRFDGDNLKNDLGSGVITVTNKDFSTLSIPSTSSATFAVPDNATYLAADGTDDFWFDSGDTLQQKTFDDLIGTDNPRTIIKYSNYAPYRVYWIGILKTGETLSDADKDALSRYFQLWMYYFSDELNDNGYLKDNRNIPT